MQLHCGTLELERSILHVIIRKCYDYTLTVFRVPLLSSGANASSVPLFPLLTTLGHSYSRPRSLGFSPCGTTHTARGCAIGGANATGNASTSAASGRQPASTRGSLRSAGRKGGCLAPGTA